MMNSPLIRPFKRGVLGAVLLAAPMLAETTAPAVPQLKTEVKLALVTEQSGMFRAALQLRQAQQELSEHSQQLQVLTRTALSRSGIDSTKYQLNPETFEVSAAPVVPAPAEVKK